MPPVIHDLIFEVIFFSPAREIEIGGNSYRSLETYYQSYKASYNGENDLAAYLMQLTSSLDAKKLSNQIQTSRNWPLVKVFVMEVSLQL